MSLALEIVEFVSQPAVLFGAGWLAGAAWMTVALEVYGAFKERPSEGEA